MEVEVEIEMRTNCFRGCSAKIMEGFWHSFVVLLDVFADTVYICYVIILFG